MKVMTNEGSQRCKIYTSQLWFLSVLSDED